MNPIAIPKPDYREVAGRGRDSEIVALRTERWRFVERMKKRAIPKYKNSRNLNV
ncbi:hypothetical protein HMPREF3228_01166 [Streptococcus mitis]|uniref:Uncharacterized protein n=1 Tax=Streptococcus mitis TaxID=28037 RepID=A0A133RYK4_STRMT|nr:hypothetical protein HMPREF3228_01166 [Streptococcus mitis]